nr:DUF4389 domain-containing protein [Arthrobacter silvisoli]
MKPGRVIMLVAGTLAALLGFGLLAGSLGVGWANYQQGENGYLTTPVERYESPSYALTTPEANIVLDGELPAILPGRSVGRVMFRASAAVPGQEVFIGIARQQDVADYLAGVRHSEVIRVEFRPFQPRYRDIPGNRTPARPGDQKFWTVSDQGQGTRQIEWDLQSGNWVVVIMNADAGSRITFDLQAGVRSDLLWPVFLGLLVAGIILLAAGVPMIVAGAAGLGRHGPPHQEGGAAPLPGVRAPVPPAPVPPEGPAAAYPARLSGYLDPKLSRGLWLIKWFLAIPHLIVLFFLWFAFVVTTIVAGFAILFTGKYPRSLFSFNVGVLRWTWRVCFYAYSAIGTDQYPPFTLARTGYPADFDVDYPLRLSRGLVLVKSWLLAIPHLLVIAAFTGSARTWGLRNGVWVGYQDTGGISLLGLLVLVAGVILLFTGVYPKSLFDLLLGINRWIYRVVAYTALMRDEYPPFRLDMGPADPGDRPAMDPGLPRMPEGPQ